MTEDKIANIKPKSHFGGLSSITNNYNDFTFMPKLFIKNLQRKQQHHRRQPSIILPTGIKLDIEKNLASTLAPETIANVAVTDKKARKSHQLMSKNVGSIMSVLFRNKKKLSDKDVSLAKHKRALSSTSADFRDKKYGSESSDKGYKSYSLVKQSSVTVKRVSLSIATAFRDGKRGLMSAKGKEPKESSSSSSSGEKTFVGKSLSKLRSTEVKPGLRIKGITRMLSRDDKRVELCKKKILMGEKCKPISGRLLYDENGVLVPEEIPEPTDRYISNKWLV
ncbi:hypothetical protein vseg_010983 [Gypsophila vaccaria]